MEAHVETFLSNRFGLQKIVHQWMHCIFSAVQNYSMEDCDVSLFAKIQNNDIDEEYKVVLDEARSNIDKALKDDIMILNFREHCTESTDYKEKMQQYEREDAHRKHQMENYMKNSHRTEIQQEKMQSDSPKRRMYIETKTVKILNEQPEFKTVSKPDTLDPNLYLYTKGGYEEMKNEFEQVKYGMIRFEQAIRVSSTIISQKDVNKLGAIIKKRCNEENNLQFGILEKVILDFQINRREKLLSKVCKIFKSQDHDDDGCINRKDIVDALTYIDPTNTIKLNRDEFVSLCDPYHTDVITFTDYAKVLVGIRVRVQGTECNIVKFTWL